jgi:hypothetical protein
MYVTVNGENYNVSAAYIFPGVDNMFPLSINLNNTQSANGNVVFEVPQGTTMLTLGWRLPSGSEIHIEWKSK